MPMCLRKTALRYTAPDMKHNSLPETPSYPEVRTGQSIAMLKALHILTRDGALNADSRRKLKQVLHLIQFLRPSLEVLLETSGEPVVADQAAAAEADASDDDEVVAQIKELLETRVRPAVAQDGGDIVFHSFEEGVVYLHMQGSCSGCPSSTATLKSGIENMLRHYIPEIAEVRAV